MCLEMVHKSSPPFQLDSGDGGPVAGVRTHQMWAGHTLRACSLLFPNSESPTQPLKHI